MKYVLGAAAAFVCGAFMAKSGNSLLTTAVVGGIVSAVVTAVQMKM